MTTTVHLANSRGKADYGWLKTHYSFSFANYRNPKRMGFGVLRVLNDDMVAPGRGFDMHGHENFEIVTIVLSGALEHMDSAGNHGVIHPGEVQRISAGSGIEHSEFNASKTEPVALLQIWVKPKELEIEPGYEQRAVAGGKNAFARVVSGKRADDVLYMHQNAAFALGELDMGVTASYASVHPGNGFFVFVISGAITVDGSALQARDAAEVTDQKAISVHATELSVVLIIDVPLR